MQPGSCETCLRGPEDWMNLIFGPFFISADIGAGGYRPDHLLGLLPARPLGNRRESLRPCSLIPVFLGIGPESR